MVRDLNGYKAPGPNDFWKSIGRLCKRKFWQYLNSFIVEGSLRRVVMQLLSPLSQKKASAMDITDFCPISLVGGVYKIMFKVGKDYLQFPKCIH